MERTILCFGDSNTYGYNAATGGRFDEEHRWTRLLEGQLGAGYRVVEEGLNGRTSVFDDPITEGLKGLDYIAPCMMSHAPIDLMIIMLGTNDTKERFGCAAVLICNGMIRLAEKAKTVPAFRTPKPNLLLIAPPPIGREYLLAECGRTMGERCAEKSEALPVLLEAAAELIGCHFLRAGDCTRFGTVDHMHLDETGHRLLAARLAEVVPTLL